MAREIRCDALTGEHVILTEVRAKQHGFHHQTDRRHGQSTAECPFCPQNVSFTRPTIETVEADGAWVARAFANRSPVVVLEESPEPQQDGMHWGQGGFGVHEVIVESCDHPPLHDQPSRRSATALELVVRRLRDLRLDERIQTLHWFRNHGPASGGSQQHPHSQILGLPYVPERWQRYAGRLRHHFDQHGVPLLRQLLEAEHRDGRRIVATEGPITALCPYAPSHAMEVWLVPEDPGRALADATDAEVAALAALTPALVRAIESTVGTPISYNLITLGAARGVDGHGVGWHMRLTPRLARHGGIERGTGNMVHGVFPEDAAPALRRHLDLE